MSKEKVEKKKDPGKREEMIGTRNERHFEEKIRVKAMMRRQEWNM